MVGLLAVTVGKCGSIAPGRGGSHPWRVQKSSNSRAKREAVVRWSAAAALSKAHANHATGELNEQQYTEKAPRTSWDDRQAQKRAVPQKYGLNSQDRAGPVVL